MSSDGIAPALAFFSLNEYFCHGDTELIGAVQKIKMLLESYWIPSPQKADVIGKFSHFSLKIRWEMLPPFFPA